jgi:hypothetical protein
VSESKPSAWGVDLNPLLQWEFDFERAVKDCWTDFFIKASEGPKRNGKVLEIPRLKEFVHRAEAAGGWASTPTWQFTWKGHVGGLYVDCDACRLSPAEHKELWQQAA